MNVYNSPLLQRRKTTRVLRFIGILFIVAQIVPPQILQKSLPGFVEAFLPADYQPTGKFNREDSFSSTAQYGSEPANDKSGTVITNLWPKRFNSTCFNLYVFQRKRGFKI